MAALVKCISQWSSIQSRVTLALTHQHLITCHTRTSYSVEQHPITYHTEALKRKPFSGIFLPRWIAWAVSRSSWVFGRDRMLPALSEVISMKKQGSLTGLQPYLLMSRLAVMLTGVSHEEISICRKEPSPEFSTVMLSFSLCNLSTESTSFSESI